MAKNQGIEIEFRGNPAPLKDAINSIRRDAKTLDKELGYVNNALKFNPKSVELWEQKQKILNEEVKKTTERVDELKTIKAQLEKQGLNNESAEFREVQREIVKAEDQLKGFKKELKQIPSAQLKSLQASFKDVGDKMVAAGQAMKGLSMVAGAVDVALGGLAYKSGKTADDLNTLSQVTGISTAELQKYKAMSDLVDVSVETVAKSQTKMKKSMLSAQQGTKATADAFNTLGVQIEDSNGHLRSQDEVFAETIEALGKMENETERDALAMQIFGRSATELNPLIEDNGETYKRVAEIFKNNDLEIVDQETIDKANAFNNEIDTIKATGQAMLNTLGMQLAGYLQPALEKVSEVIQKVFSWLSKLDPKVLTIIGIIAGVVAGLAPLLIIVGKLSLAISSIMGLMSTLGLTFGALASTILPIIAGIGALIAIGVALYKNWDKIKEYAGIVKDWVVEKWTALRDGVVNAVQNLKDKVLYYWEALKLGISVIADAIKYAITHPIEAAFTVIKTIVDKIKGLFSNFDIKLPHIKLPHFSITPAGWKLSDLLQGQLPKLGIEWYKNGAIFTKPTVFTGVGDAVGGEAVLPLKKLWDEMDKRYSSNEVVINITATPSMDVNELANAVQRRIIELENRRKMAWL